MWGKTAGRYRSKGVKNQSRFYLFLSIALVIFMVKWGVPGLVNLLATTGGGASSEEQKDTIPPQRPILSAVPEAVNEAELMITGFTEALAEVQLWLDDDLEKEDKSDESGEFSFSVSLSKGEHQLRVKAIDEAGNMSESELKRVTYDPEAMEIVIEEPSEGGEFFGREGGSITVRGKVNKSGARVMINGSLARLDEKGVFEHLIKLAEGENKIKVEAEGKAGNKAEKEITVKYYP